MAVRKPLYYNANQVKEMTTAMVTEIVHQACYQYASNPSVTITVSASDVDATSHFPNMIDQRYSSGSSITRASSGALSEALTGEPILVTTTWNRLVKANASVSPTSDSGKTWPIYQTGSGDIKAMSIADIKDTFLHPEIDLLIAAGTPTDLQGGTYIITTSNVPAAGFSVVSSTRKVFSDTKANVGSYAASNIGTDNSVQDINTEENGYFLHKKDPPASEPTYTDPLFITSGNDLQTYPSATFKALLQEWIRETASESGDGYKILYNIDGSGNTRTTITERVLTGVTGNYQTYDTNPGGAHDDYRAQEFPNGTEADGNTYIFKITKG